MNILELFFILNLLILSGWTIYMTGMNKSILMEMDGLLSAGYRKLPALDHTTVEIYLCVVLGTHPGVAQV